MFSALTCNIVVFHIADHKTAAQGPVNLGLTPELFRMLKTYLVWINQIPPVVSPTAT